MLKDTLNKVFKKEKKDIVAKSIADGYVDIKVYKQLEDGKEKLVYHDTGDNVVTNWMRSAILQMLSGKAFVADDNLPSSTRPSTGKNETYNVLKPLSSDFDTTGNKGAYILNGEQYLTKEDDFEGKYGFGIYANGSGMTGEYIYPVFPTKVLFGTGKEYNSWETLKAEHEVSDPNWYAEMLELYGEGEGEAKAKANWVNALNNSENAAGKYNANAVSSFVGNEDVHTGEGELLAGITVNDPNTGFANDNNTNDFANYYSVIGPVKTCHIDMTDEQAMSSEVGILETTIEASGRLITGKYRGAGKPAFIYFDKSTTTTDINLKADTSIKYNNKIEYRIEMPSQGAGTGNNGAYYPYNGWQLKQIGLYNDAILPAVNSNDKERNLMPSGTLLAIKNISPFTKTGDEKVVLTWTLTI